jgi:hypothetical protein
MRIGHVVLPLFALALPTLAQQQWVPLQELGSTGVVVADSPLPLQLIGGLSGASARVEGFTYGTFHARTEPVPPQLAFARAATYDAARHRIVVFCADTPLFGGGGAAPTVCAFDGAHWTVLSTNTPPAARSAPTLAFDSSRGTVILFGGLAPGFPQQQPLGDTWELDGSTWTQLAGPGPAARSGAALAPSPTGQLVLFGGVAGTVPFGDTWTFDLTGWQQQSPAASPPARSGHAMALDPAGTTVLYGGIGSSGVLGDAWSWNGATWTGIAAPALLPLSSPRLAADSGSLLLVGRLGSGPGVVHVQRWSGGTWLPEFQGAPAPDRFLPALAFDTVRGEIVRFGGRDLAGGAYYAETWTWNGVWTQHSPALAPLQRSYAPMAFDPVRNETVLFGGFDGTTALGDTWVWDGTAWQQRTPAVSPPARHLHTLAWDPGRGTVLLFGGYDAVTSFQDTWEWDGAVWAPVVTATSPPPLVGLLGYDAARAVMALYIDRGSIAPSEVWELQPSGWVLASNAAPPFAKLVYDPSIAALSLMAISGRHDRVAGAWVVTGQPSLNGYYLTDPGRGSVLGVATIVHQSTAMAGQAEVYGSGCGPLGVVTLAFDQAARLGALMQADVRALEGSVPTWLLLGLLPANVPFGGGCSAYIDALVLGFAATAAPSGWATFATPVPPIPSIAGIELFGEAVTFHATGLGFSNGARMRFGL